LFFIPGNRSINVLKESFYALNLVIENPHRIWRSLVPLVESSLVIHSLGLSSGNVSDSFKIPIIYFVKKSSSPFVDGWEKSGMHFVWFLRTFYVPYMDNINNLFSSTDASFSKELRHTT